MPELPPHPSMDRLRREAKQLLRLARAGDTSAGAQIHAVSDRVTLAAAQLAVARSYGFSSWPRLKEGVEARTLEFAQKAARFCEASIEDPQRAARLLATTPALADYGVATAAVLGDVERLRAELRRDPGVATRQDPQTGWTLLHAACGSRWHQLEPDRATGLLQVVRLLLDAGADATGQAQGRAGARAAWRPLLCAIAASNSGPSNRSVIELLLDRGAVPDDHDLYLAGFARDRGQLLPLLLVHVPDPRETIKQALAAPIGSNDAESARLLLEAGADPRHYRSDDGRPTPVVWDAVRAGCSGQLLALLIAGGADPNAAGPDGRTPYRLATRAGRPELAEVLVGHGATEDATGADRFLSACRRADRAAAQQQLEDDPGLLDRLTDDGRAALVRAAMAGETGAVELMLDLGFPLEIRDHRGATSLHEAAWAGSADTVRLLLAHGADIEARDTTWNSTPLEWAAVGSGERPTTARNADWLRTVRVLLDNGAATDGLSLGPDSPKPPSRAVAALLRGQMERNPV